MTSLEANNKQNRKVKVVSPSTRLLPLAVKFGKPVPFHHYLSTATTKYLIAAMWTDSGYSAKARVWLKQSNFRAEDKHSN